MNYKLRKMRFKFKLNGLTALCALSVIFFWLQATAASAAVTDPGQSQQDAEQQITVRGKVIDENNEPVIGATVLLVRTNGGTVTDREGNFTVTARIGDVLRISYIGYETH